MSPSMGAAIASDDEVKMVRAVEKVLSGGPAHR
jgi:hypothetical protein